jgi:hypothetical protein
VKLLETLQMFGDTSFEWRSEWFETEVLRTVSLQLTERFIVRIIPPYTRMPVDVRSPKAPLAGMRAGCTSARMKSQFARHAAH